MTHRHLPFARPRRRARLLPALLALLLVIVVVPGVPAAWHLPTSLPASSAPDALVHQADDGQRTSVRQTTETAQAPLRTVGGDDPSLTGDTEQELRSQGGSLLAASDSAWNDLTRDERAILLDGWVRWVPFESVVTANETLWEPLWLVVTAADELVDDAVALETIAINEVVLALPVAKLEPALAEGETRAIAIDADVVLMVDNVVVAQVAGGANLVPDIARGEIDDRGLIVPADSSPAAADRAAPAATERAASPPKRSATGELIPQIGLDDLPPEAIDTIILILEGGPFPFERDGAIFGNYEERLPAAEYGYYREYTVITPEEDDRGARRIVTGNDDTEFYYTDDHYETFYEIVASTDE